MNNRIYSWSAKNTLTRVIVMEVVFQSFSAAVHAICISVLWSVEGGGLALVWCCWCNYSSSGCQLWSNLHKGINIAQFSLLSISLFQCVPIRLCRRVHLTSHWLLDPILTIMSLCLFFVFGSILWSTDTILGQSWPADSFSERKIKENNLRSGGRIILFVQMMM